MKWATFNPTGWTGTNHLRTTVTAINKPCVLVITTPYSLLLSTLIEVECKVLFMIDEVNFRLADGVPARTVVDIWLLVQVLRFGPFHRQCGLLPGLKSLL